MEKVRPWCGQASDREWIKNRTEQIVINLFHLNLLKDKYSNSLILPICDPDCSYQSIWSELEAHTLQVSFISFLYLIDCAKCPCSILRDSVT